MSIMLPGYLVRALDLLGFEWPDIDEDQLREAAGHLRTYARNGAASVAATDRKLTIDIAQVCTAASYQVVVEKWASQTKGHMETLLEACELMAGALELLADAVVVMKGAVIVQLGIALDEFIAAQALAIETLGLSEAALGAGLAVQNRIIAGIISTFEAEVMSQIFGHIIEPLRARVRGAARALMYPVALHLAGVAPTTTLDVDTDAVRRHLAAMNVEGEARDAAGEQMQRNLRRLTYTGGS